MSKRIRTEENASSLLSVKRQKQEGTGLVDLPRDMLVNEIGVRLDPVGRVYLARVCRQFWDWFWPQLSLSLDDVTARGHLRWATQALRRNLEIQRRDERVSRADACAHVFGHFCANPHHLSIVSVTDVLSTVKMDAPQRLSVNLCITKTLIRRRRDDLLRQWVSPELARELELDPRGRRVPLFLGWLLVRDDYLSIFERHDLLPVVTESVFQIGYVSHLFRCLSVNDSVLLAHVVDLAGKNAAFQATVRRFFEKFAIPYYRAHSVWTFLLDWHLSRAVGIRPHSPRGIEHYSKEIGTLVHDDNLDWLPFLEEEMQFDLRPICLAFATYKSSRFVELWKAFDVKGLIDARFLTSRQVAKMLSKRSDEEVRFLRNWAQARGGLQGLVNMIDAFMQY